MWAAGQGGCRGGGAPPASAETEEESARLVSRDLTNLASLTPSSSPAARAAGAGDPFRVYGVSSDPVLQPSGLMACQNRDSCVLCDSADPRPGDCVTNAATGMTPLDPVSLSLPCNPDRCYGERWFANVRKEKLSDIGFPSRAAATRTWWRSRPVGFHAPRSGANGKKADTPSEDVAFSKDASSQHGREQPCGLPEGCDARVLGGCVLRECDVLRRRVGLLSVRAASGGVEPHGR